MKKSAFVIMPFGDSLVNRYFEEVVVPACGKNGLTPKRVDTHNRGELLKSEIIRLIGEAEIIIADLTNERPNCYLEVGYAMGKGKNSRLILSVRADHFEDHIDHPKTQKKIHFDLAGYDILGWEANELNSARDELSKRIARRLQLVSPVFELPNSSDAWFLQQRESAVADMAMYGYQTCMEICARPVEKLEEKSQPALRLLAFPLAGQNRDWFVGFNDYGREYPIVPRQDGIYQRWILDRNIVYHYSALRVTGDIYLLETFYEESHKSRVVRREDRLRTLTEHLLYVSGVYKRWKQPSNALFELSISFRGFDGWKLDVPPLPFDRFSPLYEGSLQMKETISLEDLSLNDIKIVKRVASRLFGLWDHTVTEGQYESLVNMYKRGRS